MSPSRFFATCSKGLEYLLVDELTALGAESAREALAGVHFQGEADLGLRACLWSRLASRVLLPLAEFGASGADALYDGVAAIDWSLHIDPAGSFAIDASVRASAINQGMFAAQRAKDAIVDDLRRRFGRRPDIDTQSPDVRLVLRIVHDQASLAIDLAGEPLHRRGWRQGQGEAPLKETVAAAILMRAGWPALAEQGAMLWDPFCGIGTIPIEAAWMAADIAPGLLRGEPGCRRWSGFDAVAWSRLVDEARQRRVTGLARMSARVFGSDFDLRMVDLARCHVDRAGLVERVDIGQADARRHLPPSGVPDLIVANLPYGVRLGDKPATISLYQDFGAHLRESAPQAHKALLTLADGRGRALGLRARKRYALTNGPLDCELLLFAPEAPSATLEGRLPPPVELGDGPAMVANRLSKNLRHLRRRLRREQISCFRLYDADLPEYAAAVDVYDGHAVVQEYQAPAAIPEATARQRLGYLVRAVRHVLELPRQRVIVKTRRRQRAGDQYQSRNEQDAPLVVTESGLQFEVRLREYLDTGLYLDHRLVRAWVAEHVQETDFLNLFCYTGTASVYAAAGGARSTTSVDLSANYLAWAARNLELNGFTGPRHRLIQADVMSWLANERHRYGLIYVDPPTFSNSKRADDFDIQRQHVALLSLCGERLAPGGTILFSNHFRRFRLDDAALAGRFRIDRPGPALLPFDFARDPRIHHVFVLRSHPAAN